MTDFLLELRSEEIPARMQAKAKDDLARLFAEEIAKSGLTAQSIETFATPRRLALIARGLPDGTEPRTEEIKGPKASAPDAAIDGFIRKVGISRDRLVERDGTLFAVLNEPSCPSAVLIGDAISQVIYRFPWPKSMRWGVASTSTESLRWVRPLQGIVALFGNDIVSLDIDGIEAGRTTMGHRFHHSGPVTITSAATYVDQLRAAHVIVHLSERRKLIEDGAAKAAAAAGLTVIPDEGLVLENAGLTEWPVPLLGRFDPAFLDVPREVIQLTMRTNQKYFACVDPEGRLANAFVCTANIEASDGGAAVIAGNEKVLSARLSDAKFFWEADLKVSLEEQAVKLKDIVFHEKLGTVADKVERVAKLARWLVETGVIPAKAGISSVGSAAPDTHGIPASAGMTELADMAETAARLCKADLVTGMVGEFPELQGVMGGYYARAQGLPDAVADAIRDHYKPVGQGDDVPTAPVTVAVSLADKLDSLFGFFLMEMVPTGSRDPFALRRAAVGLIEMIVRNGVRGSLYTMLERVGVTYFMAFVDAGRQEAGNFNAMFGDLDHLDRVRAQIQEVPDGPVEWTTEFNPRETLCAFVMMRLMASQNVTIDLVLAFLADRLKVQQREAGVRHDLIDAVFALGGEDDLVRLLARVKALQGFVGTDEGKNLLAGYKRAANILKKSNPSPLAGEGDSALAERGEGDKGKPSAGSLDPLSPLAGGESPSPARGEGQKITLSYTPELEEDALIDALDSAEPLATAAIAREDFEGAMAALASLRAPIDAFFEKVTVNDADPGKRDARLALLARVRDAVHRVADFSKIEG